jgi:hypothetical protein
MSRCPVQLASVKLKLTPQNDAPSQIPQEAAFVDLSAEDRVSARFTLLSDSSGESCSLHPGRNEVDGEFSSFVACGA